MRDVDFHDSTNHTACRSNYNRWDVYPVILEGPYITAFNSDGSIIPLPEDFPAYNPWEFKWIERESVLKKDLKIHGKKSTLEALRSIIDEPKVKGKTGASKSSVNNPPNKRNPH
ncbi:uncharacterized protein LOC113343521 isoform X1 [Papaver somniferum]|uniref:uncharacterized protein LOC113343521 isoform X1 n=1 Tax=Papaver somniferum TaxID=3469 RepID=UPI000E701E26|nr:uncharacterized protein LOC113343521 isoform X1 [Papaver somniferum]